MAGDIGTYQPRPQMASLVRIQDRGPRTHDLRKLLDRWLQGRQRDRDLIEKVGRRHHELEEALAERRQAYGDQDEAELDGKPVDAKVVKRLETRVKECERAQEAAYDRVVSWRERLLAREREADFYAQNHAAEIGAELLPVVAAAEVKFREAMQALQASLQRLDDEVFALDASQAVVQIGERVFSPVGGDVGQILALIGRVQGQPVMRLPGFLVALGEEAGMVTTLEGGDYIPANLPHPRGARSMNEMQAAQAQRMDELGEGLR